MQMKKLSSWGNTSHCIHEVHNLFEKDNSEKSLDSNVNGIVYAMGRSYGDVCLNPGGIAWKSTHLDRLQVAPLAVCAFAREKTMAPLV